MKRKILLKQILSMALIFGMYLSMSASAFANIDSEDANHELQETTEENDITTEGPESTNTVQVAGEVVEVIGTTQENGEASEGLENAELPENGELPLEGEPEEGEKSKEDGELSEEEELLKEDELLEEELLEELEEEEEEEEDPILTYEDNDVIINVYGEVPENANLQVTPIKAENDATKAAYDDALNKVEAAYENQEVDFIGLLAYDICFIDMDTGEEIEPSGNVTVSLDYKGSMNPLSSEVIESAESIDVEVMHINEETSQLENLSEEGKANVATESDASVTAASFTNDNFSTYIITWKGVSNKQVTINFKNRAIDGGAITELDGGETFEVSKNDGREIKPLADKLEGYVYQYAKVEKEDGTEVEADYWIYRRTGNTNSSRKYYIDFKKGGANGTNVYDLQITKNIEVNVYIYYKPTASLELKNVATGDAHNLHPLAGYKYVLRDATGNSVKGASYKVGNEYFTTDANTGEFVLKSKTEALFNELDPGDYTIALLGLASAQPEYNFVDNITTRIFEDEATEYTQINAQTTGERTTNVSLAVNSVKKVKFLNCYTKVSTDEYKSTPPEKFVEDLRDAEGNSTDKYTLTCKFKGPYETVITTINDVEEYTHVENLNVDIIIVMDKSGSMESKVNGTSKIQHVKNAVDSMIDVIADKNDVNAKWLVIDFATTAKTVSGGWVDTATVKSKVTKTIASSDSSGIGRGTNYQAGLELAQTEMSARPNDPNRPDAQRIVLFLTDGAPTYYYENGKVAGSGSNISHEAENHAQAAAAALQCDSFYAVGIGLGSMQYYKKSGNSWVAIANDTTTGNAVIASLANACTSATSKNSYNIAATDVRTILQGLAGKIISDTSGATIDKTEVFYASNVTMVDVLSDNVVLTKDKDFYINVSSGGTSITEDESMWTNGHVNADGSITNPATYTLPDGQKLTATIVGKTITLDFPDDYSLDQDYEYSVKVWVEPAQSTYDAYLANNKQYPNEGDEGTDHFKNGDKLISSLKPGFYTNDNENSKVTYTFRDAGKEEFFPKPVIPVHFKNEWEILKINDEQVPLSAAEFLLYEMGVTTDDATSYEGKSVTDNGANGKVAWGENVKIETGKKYRFSETKAPEGYVRNAEYWEITINDENVPLVEKFSANGVSKGVYEVVPNLNGNVYTYTFVYTNGVAYSLPETGGNGIYGTTAAGIVMMVIAVFLFYSNKRKEYRR